MLVALAWLACVPAVLAFGPHAHLWVGHRIAEDLRRGCTVELVARPYAVPDDICRAILSNPQSFHAGVVGPDIYPDVLAGQSTIHAGIEGGWDSADFLEHVLASAVEPAAKAYAAGFLVHAAADVFGHSYVNLYAGDVWNLDDERAVELRHAVIEKYIDARLPPGPPVVLEAPAEFVRDVLVHNGTTQPHYRIGARHLAAMMRVKSTVEDMATRADALTGRIPAWLGRCVETGVSLTAQLVDGEMALAAASKALEAMASGAEAQRYLVDRTRRAVDDAAAAFRGHESRVAELTGKLQALQQAASMESASAAGAKRAANDAAGLLSALERHIASVPPRVVVTVCDTVTEPFCRTMCPEGNNNPLCIICSAPREVCSRAERANDEHRRLSDQIAEERARLGALEAAAAEAAAKAEAARASAEAATRQQQAESTAASEAAAARREAQAAFVAADEQYRRLEGSTNALRARVDELRARVEDRRRRLVEAKALADQLQSLATQLNLVSHVLRNWQKGIDAAAVAFVRTSDQVGIGLLGGRTHLFTQYRRWLACEGAVYLAEPYQLADVPCSIENGAQRLQAMAGDLARAVLPAGMQDLVGALEDLRGRLGTELRGVLVGASAELLRFVVDPTTADFVDLLANPSHATRAKLTEVLASDQDAKGKRILALQDGADLIDRDLGLVDGVVDPAHFAALSSAVTLAKLSLLDQAAMRRLVQDVGGAEAAARYDDRRFDAGRSILLSAVRSLDGHGQWQPYGLPPPRAGGGPLADPAAQRFGYGPRDARRGGLPLFIDPVLRERVFLVLFPQQIHGALAHLPAMAPGRYPFPICSGNPFPVTFLPDGTPAARDDRCLGPDAGASSTRAAPTR